eukprot:378394_1
MGGRSSKKKKKTSRIVSEIHDNCMWLLLNILFLSSVSGYILVKEKKTWAEADAYCKKKYETHLATIRNDKDATALLALAQSNVRPHPFGPVWIGLNDKDKEGHWIFSDGTGCPKATNSCDKLKYWRLGQPNNAPPYGQHCGQIHTIDSSWPNLDDEITINNMLNDWYCDFVLEYSLISFICDSPCRVAGFNLDIRHYCECRTSCGEDICNPIESISEVFGGAPLPGDALCLTRGQTCCCSCANCPGYLDLGVV